MKNKKFNLGELKIKSFVTIQKKDQKQTVVGGAGTHYCFCTFDACDCQTDTDSPFKPRDREL